MTDSLVKSSWPFLSKHELQSSHDIQFPQQRQDDVILMKVFADLNLSMEELLQLNYCHLFLRAFHLSDIVDGSGMCITDDTWQGRANDMV